MLKNNIVYFLVLILFTQAYSQNYITNLGLDGKLVTSLKIGENIIAAGTEGNGVYWQSLQNVSDSGWNHIDLDGINIKTVYPHKSGPLGWAIGAGVNPNVDDSTFIYCSFMGSTFNPISSGIDSNAIEIFELDGFPDPSSCGETFAVSYNKLYRRYFTDTTWHSVYEVVEGNLATVKAKEKFNYVFAGGGEGFAGTLLMRSSNAGDDWEHLFPMMYVSDIEFYGREDQKIFVTDGFKILRSLDSGLSWENIFETDSLKIERMSLTSDGDKLIALGITLFYGLPRTYVFYTDDNGDNWDEIQLPIFDLVTGMDLDYNDNIYISSKSSGVYKISKNLVYIKDNDFREINDFPLLQNYPNPFNPTTKISFTVPHHGGEANVGNENVRSVQLKVYDILGNDITTLVNEAKTTGTYEVEFDGSRLTSGIYFYQLNAGKYSITKKMLLMK
jgi:type IX secretion system substrate protein